MNINSSESGGYKERTCKRTDGDYGLDLIVLMTAAAEEFKNKRTHWETTLAPRWQYCHIEQAETFKIQQTGDGSHKVATA